MCLIGRLYLKTIADGQILLKIFRSHFPAVEKEVRSERSKRGVKWSVAIQTDKRPQ